MVFYEEYVMVKVNKEKFGGILFVIILKMLECCYGLNILSSRGMRCN